MFVLSTISDLIQISPQDFRKHNAQAIEDNIHKAYANKVIQGVGLCICIWDILNSSEGLISQGDGMVNVNVKFRLVVFRPFKGEIIQGVILDYNHEGLRIGLDFFEDIWIPAPQNIFEDSAYTHAENEEVWIWTPQDSGGHEFYYDKHEPIRFRVEAEVWHDHTPQKPDFTAAADGEAPAQKPVPYTIIGSITQPGLGPLVWWEEIEEAEPDAEGGAEAKGGEEMET
ncbi:putative DNA-directed RNA polymerase III subunit 22.9 kDa [Tothia fuscella]|uniref:DNA-directed RNA polymerase subunit n=1 Tax=Tothia fuscella TaxID=1048955 RepID=A0A9P4NLY5_9PEZI|nr:putative DNA-directed RNA polymerase III subunit 22.9 kDa [Tothia fuscella]